MGARKFCQKAVTIVETITLLKVRPPRIVDTSCIINKINCFLWIKPFRVKLKTVN